MYSWQVMERIHRKPLSVCDISLSPCPGYAIINEAHTFTTSFESFQKGSLESEVLRRRQLKNPTRQSEAGS